MLDLNTSRRLLPGECVRLSAKTALNYTRQLRFGCEVILAANDGLRAEKLRLRFIELSV